MSLKQQIDQIIFATLAANQWNRRRAAGILEISETTVRAWVRKNRGTLPPEAWAENPKCAPFIRGLV